MSRNVLCAKLGIEAPGLEQPPFPGPQGQRIFEEVSAQAWDGWLKMQTMLINEHRLTPFEPKARQFLQDEREKYLFSGGSSLPQGYVPPQK